MPALLQPEESSLTTPTSNAFSETFLSGPRGESGLDLSYRPLVGTRAATPPMLRPPGGHTFATDVRLWGRSEVDSFLDHYKCKTYAEMFHRNDIDGKVLLDLDMSSLKEIGISRIGDRVKLLGGVRDLRKRAARAAPLSASQAPRVLAISVDSTDGSPLSLLPQESRSPAQKQLPTGLTSTRLRQSAQRPPPLNLDPRPSHMPSLDGVGGSPSRSATPKSQPQQSLPKALQMSSFTDTMSSKFPQEQNASLRPPQLRDIRRTPSPDTSLLPPRNNHEDSNWSVSTKPDVPLGVRVTDRRHGFNPAKPTSPSQYSTLPRDGLAASHPFAAPARKDFHDLLTDIPKRSASRPNLSGNDGVQQSQHSLEEIHRQTVRFINAEDGVSKVVDVYKCTSGVEVLEKVLRKFQKWHPGIVANANHSSEGQRDRLEIDGWAVYGKGENGEDDHALSESALLDICQHRSPRSVNYPANHRGPAVLRERGLVLRRVSHAINRKDVDIVFGPTPIPLSPNSQSHQNGKYNDETVSKTDKRRTSAQIVMSGLNVDASPPPNATRSPSSGTAPSRSKKMYNFFGHRPPSELISNHLSDYFPSARKGDLEKTVRQSMMRLSQGQGDRHTIGYNALTGFGGASPFSASLESVASPGRKGRPPSTRTVSSSTTPAAIPEEIETAHETATLDMTSEQDAEPVGNRPPLLPPFEPTGESLVDSLQEYSPAPSTVRKALRSTRRGSGGSSISRISVLSSIRRGADKSDSASLLTVDEITAEVENRRASMATMDEGIQHLLPTSPIDSEDELSESDDDEEDEDSEDARDESDKGQNRAFTSTGSKRNIKWIKGALIGAGSFGSVFLGMDSQSGLLMAVKQVDLPSGDARNEEKKRNMAQALEREIELLKELQHPNIVQYLDSASDGNNLYIFLEYVPGGSVAALLNNYGAFEELLVRNFVRQILTGLNYLHEREIIHRDIKGGNILVDNKGGIKISDFGISKKAESSLMSMSSMRNRPSLQGSVFWMAPEVVKQTSYTSKADIWSVGCLVVEMLTGTHPWAELSQMQAIFKLGSSARPATPSDISAEAADFLQRTFEINHNARPTAAGLLQHPFIVADGPPHRGSISMEQASATLSAAAASRNQTSLSGLGLGLAMKQ